jgi:hypothetical protein
MVESADGSLGSRMGKFKRGRTEEPVPGQVQHQKKRQDKQQRVLNGVLHPLPSLALFIREITFASAQNIVKKLFKITDYFVSREGD